jgi:hypothetical protein
MCVVLLLLLLLAEAASIVAAAGAATAAANATLLLLLPLGKLTPLCCSPAVHCHNEPRGCCSGLQDRS